MVGAVGGCSRGRARGFGPVWLESCKFRQVLQRVTNGPSGVGGLERRPTGRDAAALALDSSLFHLSPAPPHLPCATIDVVGGQVAATLLTTAFASTCFFAESPLETWSCHLRRQARGGWRRVANRAGFLGSKVGKDMVVYASASPFTGQRMYIPAVSKQQRNSTFWSRGQHFRRRVGDLHAT
jgi:hypothetical protein